MATVENDQNINISTPCIDSNKEKCREIVNAEINQIKTDLGLTCRTIENVGNFLFIVSIKKPSMENVIIKFQITDQYPNEVPCISVGSYLESTRDLLNMEAVRMKGKRMMSRLCQLVMEFEKDCPEENTAMNNSKSKKEMSSRKKKKKPADVSTELTKKSSMKTADDVIKRLQWDDKVQQSDISIGYLDRFVGIVEKNFDVFSWEDISSVDYYTFVIPRHRIQYFKFKKAIIWDKKKRMDNVFGSTGSGMTLHDVIDKYDDQDYEDAHDDANNSDRNNSDHDDSNDDDEFEVTINRNYVRAAAEDDLLDLDDDDEESTQKTENNYWQDLCRPNFFICIRITNEDVKKVINHIQDGIVKHDPLLESCCIPSSLLHCTLLTLRLNNAEEIAHCGQVLKEAADELSSTLPKTPLWLHGTGCFHSRVLHAKVHHGNDFMPFVNHLRAVVTAKGVPIMENHEFIPHVTIMKTTRPVSRLRGTANIPEYMYSGTEDVDFGEQSIQGIYLCSMEKARGPDGFYITPDCVTFERHFSCAKK